MTGGTLLISPGNVPRQTSVSAGVTTMYITFDIVGAKDQDGKAIDSPAVRRRHEVVGDPRSRTEDFKLVGVGNRVGTLLSGVFEFGLFSTPVAVYHIDGKQRESLNKRLLAVADEAAADESSGYGGFHRRWEGHGVFQTGRKLLAGELEPGSALADLRAAIYRSIQAMLSSAPTSAGEGCSNVFTAEPGTCEVRQQQKDEVGHVTLDITSSWLNKIKKVDPQATSIYQGSHDHMGWKSGISGVYYASDGWSTRNDDEDGGIIPPDAPHRAATRFNIMKPFRFDGVAPRTAEGTNKFLSVDPTPGTLLLFPSWLPHSADLHVGDEPRISIAFNVAVGRGEANDNVLPGFDFGFGGPPPTAFPVFIPSDQCNEDLCAQQR